MPWSLGGLGMFFAGNAPRAHGRAAQAGVVALSRADLLEAPERAQLRAVVSRLAPQAVWVETVHRPQALRAADGRQEPLEAIAGQPVAAFWAGQSGWLPPHTGGLRVPGCGLPRVPGPLCLSPRRRRRVGPLGRRSGRGRRCMYSQGSRQAGALPTRPPSALGGSHRLGVSLRTGGDRVAAGGTLAAKVGWVGRSQPHDLVLPFGGARCASTHPTISPRNGMNSVLRASIASSGTTSARASLDACIAAPLD